MDVSIRPVTVADAEAIVGILNPIIEAGSLTRMEQVLSVQEQAEFFQSFPEQGVFHVAVCEISQTLLGLQDVVPIAIDKDAQCQTGEISTFVALGFHRQGVGRSLCKATFQSAKAKGFQKLNATVQADNPNAIAFYKGQGFADMHFKRCIARHRVHQLNAVLLERTL